MTDSSDQEAGGAAIDRGGGLHLATVPPLRGRRAGDGSAEKTGHSGRDDSVEEEEKQRQNPHPENHRVRHPADKSNPSAGRASPAPTDKLCYC